MTGSVSLSAFLDANPHAILCEVTGVRGSSPRDPGAFMVVGMGAIFGTIGGGALEYMVIDHARRLLVSGQVQEAMDVPLGPEIGQCCGGRVEVDLRYVNAELRQKLVMRLATEEASKAQVYIFGAGHIGRVLAQIMVLMPVKIEVIDTRQSELDLLPLGIPHRRVAMPEALVRSAPAGSAFVIMTHDHALDFLIAGEALARSDSAYVGMVGSKSKRAKFTSWFLQQGGEQSALERLILPIGSQGLGDKRPSVIAALAAAEIIVQIGGREASAGRKLTPASEGVGIGR